jgi:hypothetical protein
LGNWLAGFIDGEGCFQIYTQPHSKTQMNFAYRCHFSITLRRDDESILRELQRITGLGSIVHTQPNRGNPAVRWQVHAKADCVALVILLDRYPLRAKKAADYAIWRQAVSAWQRTKKGGNRRGRNNDYSEMAAYAEALTALRRYDGSSGLPLPEQRSDPQLRLVS